jgi:hypothetical protein
MTKQFAALKSFNKSVTLPIFLFLLAWGMAVCTYGQNVGIGTTNPQSQLHVNGDFRLKNGVPVTTISADSMFTHASDTAMPTQKAMQRYLQKGLWAPQSGNLQSSILFRNSVGANLDGPQSVFVHGNYAYVASRTNSRLCIYDISDPNNMVAKGFINTNLSNPNSVVVQGNYAYVTSQSNNRLCIYDISNPDNIVAKGFSSQNLNYPWSVHVQGNYAYVASLGNNRLCIYDISNPDNIVAKGFSSQNLNQPRSVQVQGNYAYVTSFLNNQFCIFDVSNPDNIVAK